MIKHIFSFLKLIFEYIAIPPISFKEKDIFFFSLFFFMIPNKLLAYDITFSLGNLCEHIGKIQTNENGDTNLCSFNPVFSGAYIYPLSSKWALATESGFTIPKHHRDDNILKMSLFLLGNGLYQMESFHLVGGGGFFLTRISGEGGLLELNNGTTTTSFYVPNQTIYARNFIINLGGGKKIDPLWDLDFNTYIFNLLKSEERSYSFLIKGIYHWGEF